MTVPTTATAAPTIVHAPGRSALAVVALIAAFFYSPLGLLLGFLAHRKVQRTGQKGARLAVAAMAVGGAFLAFDLLVARNFPGI